MPQPKGRKPKNIKLHNQKLVINLLINEHALSANEISVKTNLSITTAIKLIDSLTTVGIVKSIGKGESTSEGGKKPELYVINKTYKYAIGCYLSEKTVNIILVDFLCQTVDSVVRTFSFTDKVDEALKEFANGIEIIMNNNKIQPNQLCGISVGIDGIVDYKNGNLIIPSGDNHWGRNVNITKRIYKLLPNFSEVKIMLDNAGRFASYSLLLSQTEYRNKSVFSIITGDYSVGCLIDNGDIIHGSNNLVGEIGHIQILPEFRDYKCECGSWGCFGSLIPSSKVLYYAKQIGPSFPENKLLKRIEQDQCTYQEIFNEADKGNNYGMAIVDHFANIFSALIRSISLIYNPDVISIVGMYSYSGNYFKNAVYDRNKDIPYYASNNEIRLDYDNTFDIETAHKGGAYYMIMQYLKNIKVI